MSWASLEQIVVGLPGCNLIFDNYNFELVVFVTCCILLCVCGNVYYKERNKWELLVGNSRHAHLRRTRFGGNRVKVTQLLVVKHYYHYDTSKCVAHVLEGAVSKKHRHRPRTEITDTSERHNCGLKCHRGGSLMFFFLKFDICT